MPNRRLSQLRVYGLVRSVFTDLDNEATSSLLICMASFRGLHLQPMHARPLTSETSGFSPTSDAKYVPTKKQFCSSGRRQACGCLSESCPNRYVQSVWSARTN